MVAGAVWLLDTNIISEATRPNPNANVLENLKRNENELALCAPVWHELRFGWLRMEPGKRKDAIGRFVQEVAGALPVLPYDAAAATIHAQIRQKQESAGRALPYADAQIAAIAIAHGLVLITRNTQDFEAIEGLRLENWFDDLR